MARLEESLGVQLLQRTTRAVQLTDAGRLYFEEASRALCALEQAQETLSQLDSRPQGAVRITAPVGPRRAGPGPAGRALRPPHARHHAGVHPHRPPGEPGGGRRGPGGARRALRDSSLISRRVNGLEAWLFASPAYLDARGTPTSLQRARRARLRAVPARAVGRPSGRWWAPVATTRVTVRGPVLGGRLHLPPRGGAGGRRASVFCRHCTASRTSPEAGWFVSWRPTPAPPLRCTSSGPPSRHVPKRVMLVREWLVKSLGAIDAQRRRPRTGERTARGGAC